MVIMRSIHFSLWELIFLIENELVNVMATLGLRY